MDPNEGVDENKNLNGREVTSCRGPKERRVGSLFSRACSHDFMTLWSSLRWPHFGNLARPGSHITRDWYYVSIKQNLQYI